MEGTNQQKSTIEPKFFTIPINEYEIDMKTKSAKRKKKEILDLFNNHNKLRSREEFKEIKDDLHRACIVGDLDLIKILLSETIKNNSNGLLFKIDSTNQTASLLKVTNEIEEVIIPRAVEHESVEYLITSITGIGGYVKTLKFVEDSAVKTIYRYAFQYPSKIREIYFPTSLEELEEGWCCDTKNLTKITISPSNGQFKIEKDKYLIGKSDPNKDEFDNLLFACRDVKEISIPSNIKIISPYALRNCEKLTKVEIPTNSNLQAIKKYAFSFTKIKEIYIPSNIKIISSYAFEYCSNLTKVEIPTNSNLQTIEEYAFSDTIIEKIYFPTSLRELKEGWCHRTDKLTKITISPSNDRFIFKDDKYLFGKSDQNNNDFDIFLFASRDIKEISIPSNIKIISSCAFEYCSNLTKVEIPTNSNLQTIESDAFSNSNIKEIIIPSKVSKICKYAFFDCKQLVRVEIPTNSNLQTIESNAFSHSKIKEIIIPSKVNKICGSAFYFCENLTKVEIPTNSNLQTIKSNAFSFTKIEEVYFPTNLKELKEGWCFYTEYLTNIIISPLNDQFIFKEDKYLIGKSDPNKDEFDKLLFACRDIKEISIPSNIKIISSYAFEHCSNLTKVEIPANSNLQTIESNAFSYSNIKEIIIPSKVSKIGESSFSYCTNLMRVEIPTNSNLQTIESDAFSSSKFKDIFIPSKVSMISEDAFFFCDELQIVEISEESKLESFPLAAFDYDSQCIIMIPSSLDNLNHLSFSITND